MRWRPRSSTVRRVWCGTRPRTGCTRRRRCWYGCCVRTERNRRPLSERIETQRTWLGGRWSRLNGPQRIAGVDLARGLAVLGMVAAHVLWIENFDARDASTWIAVVDGRSSILFATLAGVSIGLVTGGTRPLAPPEMRLARERLAVRGALLWLIGLGLIATGVPVYVILPAYA